MLSGPSSRRAATPTLTVTAKLWPPASIGAASTARRMRPATTTAPGPGHFGQQHQELVAAVAHQHVFLAQAPRAEVGEALQHLVADALAVLLVHRAEVVDVDHDDRKRLAGAARARELALGDLVEGAAVVGAGERIHGREALRLALGALLVQQQEGERGRRWRLRRPRAKPGPRSRWDVPRPRPHRIGDKPRRCRAG